MAAASEILLCGKEVLRYLRSRTSEPKAVAGRGFLPGETDVACHEPLICHPHRGLRLSLVRSQELKAR